MCGPDKCDKQEILLPNGKCEQCKIYGHPSKDGKKCVSDHCRHRQYLDEAGHCQHCPLFTRPSVLIKILCVAETCKEDEKLALDGTCIPKSQDISSYDEIVDDK